MLLNLFTNAFYAVQQRQKAPPPPKEEIVTANSPVGTVRGVGGGPYQPTVRVQTRCTDGQAEIRVTDNGTGMSDAVKTKIFQPFFTTKPTGEGTGLGLSLAYDIVTKGHGGTLTVESREGEGTEFLVRLPA